MSSILADLIQFGADRARLYRLYVCKKYIFCWKYLPLKPQAGIPAALNPEIKTTYSCSAAPRRFPGPPRATNRNYRPRQQLRRLLADCPAHIQFANTMSMAFPLAFDSARYRPRRESSSENSGKG